MSPEARLNVLNIVLPEGSPPAGNYVSAVRSGSLLFISGKAPSAIDGKKPKGKLGGEYSAEDGYRFARSACLELLATVRKELGSLDQVAHFVELQGSLNSTPDFEDHAHVLDGASDLLAELFGEIGMHARSVIGVASLRNNVPLTLRAVVEIKPNNSAVV